MISLGRGSFDGKPGFPGGRYEPQVQSLPPKERNKTATSNFYATKSVSDNENVHHRLT